MLRGMRKASSNWLGKIIMAVVMGVLIISFGIWGIADIFRGFGQSTLAKIGHTEISTEQFRAIYPARRVQNRAPRGLDQELPPDFHLPPAAGGAPARAADDHGAGARLRSRPP